MNYCLKCGGLLERKGPGKYICIKCSRSFYDNPKSGVAIVLYTQDKKNIILAKRSRNPSIGKLDFIGGFLDDGETFEDAAYRELEEESGLTRQDIGNLIYSTSIYNPYEWEGSIKPTVNACFLVEIKKGANITAADDVEDFVHLKVDSLPLGDRCAWVNMDATLSKMVQLLAEI
ncbi:MAG: NUDIX domain-containing protein [bacterium]